MMVYGSFANAVPSLVDVEGSGIGNQQVFLLQEGEHRGGSSSITTLVTTVITLLLVSVPVFFAFLYLRKNQSRIYAPRTYLDTIPNHEKTPLPEALGFFSWIPEFYKLPDDFVLHHQSLDNYLFIRFFRMISGLCLTGTIATWLSLLWINFFGGGNEKGLHRFAISNVANPDRYYAHALVGCGFFGFVFYIITRETVYYINLRQAYFTASRHTTRISPRTVLFTSVPKEYLNEHRIKSLFSNVKRVWLVTDCRELEKLVKEQEHAARSLEAAEVKLSAIAVKKHLRGEKHHSDDPEQSRSATSAWVLKKERPTIKTKPIIGQKFDAVEYYRNLLSKLLPKVASEQERHKEENAQKVSAVFVEFETQRAAQVAYKTPFWKQPGRMQASAIGIGGAAEVIWKNLTLGTLQRLTRSIIAHAVIIFLVLFWSIPISIATALVDIDDLAETVAFLGFLKNLPAPVLGLITGILPAVVVSLLLALVPVICRIISKLSGSVSLKQVELQLQSWYFSFQVVQLFLVTTFSSGAASVAKQIWEDPSKTMSLLAKNLPKASTFYISYFLLQGLTLSASAVFQVVPLLMIKVLGPFLDTTPRQKFQRWITLPNVSWGQIYPKVTNLLVIAIAYSGIAPLVLGFAAAGLHLLYLAFRYNVFYVFHMVVDTGGETYGRALQQIAVGVYLAELSLTGLFAAGGGSGPAKLMFAFFILTAIYHTYASIVLGPLTIAPSDEPMGDDEEQDLLGGGSGDDGSHPTQAAVDSLKTTLSWVTKHQKTGGVFAPFLFHGPRSSYQQIRNQLLSSDQPLEELSDGEVRNFYLNPAITAKEPTLWIAKDPLGVSRDEIHATRHIVDITDQGARFDDKGKIIWDINNLTKLPAWNAGF